MLILFLSYISLKDSYATLAFFQECDPFTQKFISSLAEKDRITDQVCISISNTFDSHSYLHLIWYFMAYQSNFSFQTSSLLESLRKKDQSMLVSFQIFLSADLSFSVTFCVLTVSTICFTFAFNMRLNSY